MTRRNLADERLAGWIAFCANSQMREGCRMMATETNDMVAILPQP
jgi:hypothetical protein